MSTRKEQEEERRDERKKEDKKSAREKWLGQGPGCICKGGRFFSNRSSFKKSPYHLGRMGEKITTNIEV
jgi:hypothetical protein